MKYQLYNPKAENIMFLTSYAGMTDEAAAKETLDKWEYSALLLHIAVRKCKQEGHKLVDAGSHAGPEGAADHFACRRCGISFDHTYF